VNAITRKEIKISLRTADHTRKADLELNTTELGSDVLQAAMDNWALPGQTDYSLVNTSTGEVLSPGESLLGKVKEGDVLEVQPVLVAGISLVPVGHFFG
jgi:hypothetical protein